MYLLGSFFYEFRAGYFRFRGGCIFYVQVSKRYLNPDFVLNCMKNNVEENKDPVASMNLVTRNISLELKQLDWVRAKKINLSRYVRSMIDYAMTHEKPGEAINP